MSKVRSAESRLINVWVEIVAQLISMEIVVAAAGNKTVKSDL